MGVYIKGLKLPSAERQGELLILTDDGRCVDMFSGEYEAVELPPHGRLIEEEPIIKYITDGLNSGKFGYDAIEVLAEIKYAPTIIPAEEGE